MNPIKETRLKRWASSFSIREKNSSFNEENTEKKNKLKEN